MFRWLYPDTCPCDVKAKEWVEERLDWLSQSFDRHVFNGRPMVLPTPAYFPDPYDQSESSARVLFERVCEYMDVLPSLTRLHFVKGKTESHLVNEHGHALPTAAGTYQQRYSQFLITINQDELVDPMSLVGTMAHELSHLRLMGEGRVVGDEYDNELLTDLNVVTHGMGIFLANVPRNWMSHYSTWPDSTLKKPEYMTPPMFGYALAHIAWFRGDFKPAWSKHLHWHARTSLNQAIRFLCKTSNSSFKPRRYGGQF